MKKGLLLILALLVLVGGYFAIKGGGQEPATGIAAGEIVEVSLDQIAFDGPALVTIQSEEGETHVIAVPSMGLPVCAARENIADIGMAAVGDTIEVSGKIDEEGRIVPCEDESHYLSLTGSMQDAVFGFQFDYRKGPDGYITFEDTESVDPDYVTGIMLFNKREYELFEESTDAREGPPAMHVRVYRNDEKLHAPVWALRKPRESNIELALDEPQEAVVGGANASFYVVDGLYPIDTYVVANGEHMYILMGSYLDANDAIHEDFQELVSSFTFIPSSGDMPQGKIDVRVACESALAYMTFESGAEADAFVEAGINGDHPEVINRYIEDRGLDGATI